MEKGNHLSGYAALLVVVLGASCTQPKPLLPALGPMPDPPSHEFVRMLEFMPPDDTDLELIDELPPALGDYIATFAEDCTAVTEYQTREIGRRDDEWGDLVSAERRRSEALDRYIVEQDPILPPWAWALIGAGVGFAAGSGLLGVVTR